MTTAVVGIRDFRTNLFTYIKDKTKTYLVTVRNKPSFEVKPCINESINMDETQVAYYNGVEKSLDFWNDEIDDNIFQS